MTPPIQPTLPFHVARAYAPASGNARPTREPAPDTGPIARIGSPSPARQQPINPARPDGSQLVAGRVAGGIDFTADKPVSRADASLQMYRHPADRNQAATLVDLGRKLDISG